MWGELWSTLATGRVGRYLYASYAFAFVLYFAVIALPHAVASFTTCLFPIVSTVILRLSQREPKRSPSQVDFEVESFSPLKIAVAVVVHNVDLYGSFAAGPIMKAMMQEALAE